MKVQTPFSRGDRALLPAPSPTNSIRYTASADLMIGTAARALPRASVWAIERRLSGKQFLCARLRGGYLCRLEELAELLAQLRRVIVPVH
jgi:hypothetical protein